MNDEGTGILLQLTNAVVPGELTSNTGSMSLAMSRPRQSSEVSLARSTGWKSATAPFGAVFVTHWRRARLQ